MADTQVLVIIFLVYYIICFLVKALYSARWAHRKKPSIVAVMCFQKRSGLYVHKRKQQQQQMVSGKAP